MSNDSTDVISSRNDHRFLHANAGMASGSIEKKVPTHTFSMGKSEYITIKM